MERAESAGRLSVPTTNGLPLDLARLAPWIGAASGRKVPARRSLRFRALTAKFRPDTPPPPPLPAFRAVNGAAPIGPSRMPWLGNGKLRFLLAGGRTSFGLDGGP